jgi:hypothetical protein
LVWVYQLRDYEGIVPELAARQARGIIMLDVSLRLSRLIQFSKLKPPSCYLLSNLLIIKAFGNVVKGEE